MLIVELLFGALLDDRVMERKPHTIGLEKYSAALPAVAPDVTGPIDNLIELSDDHC
jgi:hypothetical protein